MPDSTQRTLSCEDAIAFVCDAVWGFAEVDREGRFVWVNDAYCQILNAPRDLILGTTFAKWTYLEDLEVDLKLAKEVAEGERSGYTLPKRYNQRGGTPLRPMIIWGLLSVSGKWKGEVFAGYRVQFRPYNNVDQAQKEASKIQWKKVADWVIENWKTVALIVAASMSLIYGGSEKLIDVLQESKRLNESKATSSQSSPPGP